VARSFTYFYPGIVLISGNLHIHHFWFGIALLAIGGWAGISYNHKEIDMLAAIIYGVGGGLIVDEVGLLLTFGDYWSGITWTFVIVLVASVSVLILLGMFRQAVFEELHDFVSKKASLYIGIFLAAISIAFIVETDHLLVTVVSAGLTVTATLMVLAYFIHRMRTP
jgi:multisubunit Na+/H+ antiporter MnhG subunit